MWHSGDMHAVMQPADSSNVRCAQPSGCSLGCCIGRAPCNWPVEGSAWRSFTVAAAAAAAAASTEGALFSQLRLISKNLWFVWRLFLTLRLRLAAQATRMRQILRVHTRRTLLRMGSRRPDRYRPLGNNLHVRVGIPTRPVFLYRQPNWLCLLCLLLVLTCTSLVRIVLLRVAT